MNKNQILDKLGLSGKREYDKHKSICFELTFIELTVVSIWSLSGLYGGKAGLVRDQQGHPKAHSQTKNVILGQFDNEFVHFINHVDTFFLSYLF